MGGLTVRSLLEGRRHTIKPETGDMTLGGCPQLIQILAIQRFLQLLPEETVPDAKTLYEFRK